MKESFWKTKGPNMAASVTDLNFDTRLKVQIQQFSRGEDISATLK